VLVDDPGAVEPASETGDAGDGGADVCDDAAAGSAAAAARRHAAAVMRAGRTTGGVLPQISSDKPRSIFQSPENATKNALLSRLYRRSVTRRQLLTAAGAALLAPGCLGNEKGGPATAAPAQPPAPPRLVGPVRAAVPAGSLDAADAADFTRVRGPRVDVVVHTGGPGLAQLLAGGSIDAVLARQDDIAALTAEGLLAPLDHSLVPNLADVAPPLLDQPYDPGNRHSAPARHGTFGFAYRADTVTEDPASWEDFFALLPGYSRRGIVLLPSPIETVAAALAAGGADINSDDADDLTAARALLVGAMPHVNAFSTNPAASFASEALVLAMGTASAFDDQAAAATFVLPGGGAESWIDAWAVTQGSPRLDAAHAFVNHQLSPASQARDWTFSRTPAAVPNAARLVSARLRTDPRTRLGAGVGSDFTPALLSPVGLAQRAQIWAEIGRGA
jgi:spermidine/putrescine transport system substrate-binding protein